MADDPTQPEPGSEAEAPQRFFGMLRFLGAEVVETIAFGDHQRLAEADAQRLLALAERRGATLVSTAKDMARLKGATGALADLANRRRNGDRVFFSANQHINPTNVCILRNTCVLCSFARMQKEDGAYTRSLEEVFHEAEQARGMPTREFHIVGGLHPKLRLSYYTDMIRGLKERHPQVHIKALTAVEIAHLARIEKVSEREVLLAMREAGLPVRSIAPQGAIYLSAQFDLIGKAGLRTNDDIRKLLLDKAGFALVPFQAFGLKDDTGWFRLSVGAVSMEEIQAALPRVEAVLRQATGR